MKETGDQLSEELSRLQQSCPMPPDTTASEETKKHYEQSVAPLKGKMAAVESKLQKCAEQIAVHEADVRALHERAIRSTASNTSVSP